jgi:hypothetical protein
MEVSLFGEEVASGNAAQGVISFELLNQELDAGAVVVKPSEFQRSQWQVRNQDLVVILPSLNSVSWAVDSSAWGRRTTTKRYVRGHWVG